MAHITFYLFFNEDCIKMLIIYEPNLSDGDEGPGLSALLGADLGSDDDDDNYDSAEEPEGSDGDHDISDDDNDNTKDENGAGSSGLSKPGSSG